MTALGCWNRPAVGKSSFCLNPSNMVKDWKNMPCSSPCRFYMHIVLYMHVYIIVMNHSGQFSNGELWKGEGRVPSGSFSITAAIHAGFEANKHSWRVPVHGRCQLPTGMGSSYHNHPWCPRQCGTFSIERCSARVPSSCDTRWLKGTIFCFDG